MKQLKLMKVLLALFVIVVGGCATESSESRGSDTDDAADYEETAGGELRVAISAQPPTLEPSLTSNAETQYAARNMFETLMTLNAEYEPVPMLAEEVKKSADGKTFTFILRKGVTFHNGEEMLAEDVVASMNRWLENSQTALTILGDATFEEENDYTVILQLPEVSSEAIDVIASPKQFAAIMPKEVIESATEDGIEEYIGTGPFKFVEWKQDQYIHFTKFVEYQALSVEPSGLSGKKEALVDDLYLEIVPDPSTRLSGLQTKEYDIATSMPHDNYEQLKNDPNITPFPNLYGNFVLLYNKKKGMFTDVNMRKAVNTALDFNEVLLGALSDEDLYELDPGYMNKIQKNWYSDAGNEAYNQADSEKAKDFLNKADYKGEELKLLVTRDYENNYKAAVIVKEQLEKIGINAKLEVYDWPTFIDREKDPNSWDMAIMGFSNVTTPSQVLYIATDNYGWSDDPKVDELLKNIKSATSQEEAKQHWDELQEYSWTEYVPVTSFGSYKNIFATTNGVDGFSLFEGPVYWNTKIQP